MANKWKDVSSYSRGEKDRTPRTWELRTHDLRIVITRHIDYPADVWCLRVQPMSIGPIALQSKDIDAAKAEALELVRALLRRMLASLEEG